MSRSERIKSSTGIYHVILRGTDQRDIFTDDIDRMVFTKAVKRAKELSGFKLYAYCLMDNHIHMLIKEGDEPLEQIFKRIGVSYAAYYNRKNDLYGHLFQDRFRSEAVESNAYFMDILRYICQNPIKAGLCASVRQYEWVECSGVRNDSGIIDSITEYTSLSGRELNAFICGDCTHEHIDEKGHTRLKDMDAVALLNRLTSGSPQELCKMDMQERSITVKKCLNSGISIRQLARITGVSKYMIEKLKKG